MVEGFNIWKVPEFLTDGSVLNLSDTDLVNSILCVLRHHQRAAFQFLFNSKAKKNSQIWSSKWQHKADHSIIHLSIFQCVMAFSHDSADTSTHKSLPKPRPLFSSNGFESLFKGLCMAPPICLPLVLCCCYSSSSSARSNGARERCDDVTLWIKPGHQSGWQKAPTLRPALSGFQSVNSPPLTLVLHQGPLC